MTVLVGVRCSDGIVVGADSAATSSAGIMPIIRTDTDKIFLIKGRFIVAATGAVGLAQRFCQIVASATDGNLFARQSALDASKMLARSALEDFQRSYVQKHPQTGLNFGVVLAGVFTDGPSLIEFGTLDFQPELKKDKLFFVSMGSGQPLADPFIAFIKRVLWKDQAPSVDSAMVGVYWALSHTITCAPGQVGHPISLAALARDAQRNWQVRLLGDVELQEKAEHIRALEVHLCGYVPRAIENAPAAPIPAAPG